MASGPAANLSGCRDCTSAAILSLICDVLVAKNMAERWRRFGLFSRFILSYHGASDISARTHCPGRPLDYQKKQSTTCSSRNVDSFDLSLTHGLLGNILIHELDFGCRIVSFAGVTSKLSQIDIVFWKASIEPTLRALDTEPFENEYFFFRSRVVLVSHQA